MFDQKKKSPSVVEQPVTHAQPIQITTRDQHIIRAINRLGYVDARYVAAYFRWHQTLTYRRLHQLVQHGYLQYTRLFHGKPGVYRATRRGTALTQDALPPLRHINLATYTHQLQVAQLSLRWHHQAGVQFISERELRHQLGITTANTTQHLPDGVVVTADQRIAIEVELSMKSQARLERILRTYRKAVEYQAVWYFCGHRRIQRKLETLTRGSTFIQTYLIRDEGDGDSRD